VELVPLGFSDYEFALTKGREPAGDVEKLPPVNVEVG
jgi:hypothetical protein